MFLEKVKDLEKVKLGKQQVLVELVHKTYKSSLIITDIPKEEGTNELLKAVVIASNFEEVSVGDVLVEYRLMLGQNGMLTLGDRRFAVVAGHDIKIWTDGDNYDENKEADKKESAIMTAKAGLSDIDRKKIEFEAKGIGSKHVDNRRG